MAEQDDTRLGNVLTPEEYQSRFVDFYAPYSIQVQSAPEVDEPEEETEPLRPDILTPVGQRGDQPASNVFAQIPLTSDPRPIFGRKDYQEYIKEFDEAQNKDLSDDKFDRYLEQAGGPLGMAVSPAMKLPVGAIMYGVGQLAKKEHRKNAAAIQEAGGKLGDMFMFNNMTVSRAPGSRFFTGNLSGLSQEDMYRSREIERGFIPGTMSFDGPEVGLGGVTSVSGAIMDAFGTVHGGQRNESGHMMVSAGQAQRLREQEFVAAMRAEGLGGKINQMKRDGTFTMAAVDYKQFVDGQMKSDPSYGGFFHKTSNLSASANNAALNRRKGHGSNFVKDKYGIADLSDMADQPDEVIVPDKVITEGDDSTPPPQPSGGGGGGSPQDPPPGAQSGFGYEPSTDYGFGYSGFDPSDIATDVTEQFDDDFARGGRVGMQMGGAAQQPLPEAGFVAGPPENFTERETVADDQNGSVAEGTFVINAAAVEFAGSDDIRKMILDAYSTAREKGLDIGRVDRKLYEGTVDVALSKGEVVVPPELAKIIGYDRLEKINNRGKKEVSRRQEAAGGGFLDGKKYAKGDKVTVYRGEPLDPAKNQGVRTDYGYDQKYVGTHHTPDLRRAQGYANYGNQPGNRVIRSMKVTADEFFDGMQELIVTNNQKARNNKSRMPVSKKLDDDFSRFIESMRNRVLTGQTSLDEITRNMIMNEAVFPNKKSKINFVETYKNDPKSAGKLVAKTISKLGRKAVPVIGAIETAYGMLAPSPLGDATLNPNIRFDDD